MDLKMGGGCLGSPASHFSRFSPTYPTEAKPELFIRSPAKYRIQILTNTCIGDSFRDTKSVAISPALRDTSRDILIRVFSRTAKYVNSTLENM